MMAHNKSAHFILSRFSWRRSRTSAIVWALILGVYAYSKTIGYALAYPSYGDKLNLAGLMAKSTGLNVLVGPNYRLQTTAGYMVWATYMVMIICGSIWGILLVTKQLRGDEETGRLDSILSAEISLRGLTTSVLRGLFMTLSLFFIILSLMVVSIGQFKAVSIAALALVFYALAICLAIGLFMLVGSFTSQLMPSRKQASGLALAFFGISFILKAIADVSSAKWLLNITPLGWFEKLKPLENPQLVWLLPILGLGLVLYMATVYLASRRELNQSLIAERSSYKSRLKLLTRLPLMTFRFNRSLVIIWLAVLCTLSLIYGLLTKAAVSLIGGSSTYLRTVGHLASSANNSNAVSAFAGAVFFINILLLCFYVSSCLNSLRKDELNSYDVNILTKPIGRVYYLSNKLMVQIGGLILMAIGISLSFWIGEFISGDKAVGLNKLLSSGFNALVPAVMVLGLSLLLFGIWPRISNLIIYGLIVWSILISLLATGLKVNKNLTDLSFFSHIKLAPVVSPDWHSNIAIVLVSGLVGLVGIYLYKRRDLIND